MAGVALSSGLTASDRELFTARRQVAADLTRRLTQAAAAASTLPSLTVSESIMCNQTGRRDNWLMGTTALATPLIIGTIVLLPKGAEYAAPDRFVMTATVFASAVVGSGSFVAAWRRHREALMQWRFGAASSAVADTLTYLRNEQRLARRGRLPALMGSISCLGLHVLSHWPQLAVLAPYRTAFGIASLGLLAAVPILALRNRGHIVNAWFLWRYLKQQLDHLGYGPRRGALFQRRGMKREPVVTVTGPGRFRIGDFEWRFDDLVKNVLIVGAVGSGKTVCLLNSLLYGLIASNSSLKISGLVLDAKGDFHGKLQHLCAELGRAEDLVVLDPSTWEKVGRTLLSIAWNVLDNRDDALEVATRLIAALRLIGLEQGSEGSFFLDSAKVFLRHAITLVRAAADEEPPSLIDVYQLAQEDEEETPFYHKLIEAISARHPGEVPREVLDAIAYFEKEWRRMADRQKSAVQGTLTQLLDEFLVAPFREIFSGTSTISIADIIDQGKILYVHMPASDRERMSRLICTLIKLEFQRQILLRPRKERPSFFLCDEFQTFYTAGEGRGDSDFWERSRESNHANIVASQNVSAFLKRTRNRNDVMNFLGNSSVKLFLRNTEEETNRWASALFGQRSEIVVTTSEQAALDGSWRRRNTSYGRSTRTLPRVPPEAFTRLAIPIRGDARRQFAESIVHLGSRGETEHHTLVWPVNPLE